MKKFIYLIAILVAVLAIDYGVWKSSGKTLMPFTATCESRDMNGELQQDKVKYPLYIKYISPSTICYQDPSIRN